MTLFRTLTTLALAAMITATGAALALAASKKGKSHITARSDYGNGNVTAPVRKSRFGYQVLLPGGLWYDCEVSCIYTLRRESVDFWETQQETGDGGDYD